MLKDRVEEKCTALDLFLSGKILDSSAVVYTIIRLTFKYFGVFPTFRPANFWLCVIDTLQNRTKLCCRTQWKF